MVEEKSVSAGVGVKCEDDCDRDAAKTLSAKGKPLLLLVFAFGLTHSCRRTTRRMRLRQVQPDLADVCVCRSSWMCSRDAGRRAAA